MEFKEVKEPTVTVVLQYPKTDEMIVCKVSFEKDLDLALLRATFAIKEQMKINAKKEFQRILTELGKEFDEEIEKKLTTKKENKNKFAHD